MWSNPAATASTPRIISAPTAGFATELRNLLARCAERGLDPLELPATGPSPRPSGNGSPPLPPASPPSCETCWHVAPNAAWTRWSCQQLGRRRPGPRRSGSGTTRCCGAADGVAGRTGGSAASQARYHEDVGFGGQVLDAAAAARRGAAALPMGWPVEPAAARPAKPGRTLRGVAPASPARAKRSPGKRPG